MKKAKEKKATTEVFEENTEEKKRAEEAPQGAASTETKKAFSGSPQSVEKGKANTLDFILDIPLEVTAELGRARMLINELLKLGQGSVIELTKLAGEPIEILVNQKLIARGEVVVVNEKFGVRLTDILSPTERIEQLG